MSSNRSSGPSKKSSPSASESPQRSASGGWKRVVGWLFLVIFLTVFIALWWVYRGVQTLQQPVNVAESNVFEIEPGDSLRTVAQRLEEQGIIESSFWFYWVGRFNQQDRTLKAGEYALSPEYTGLGLFPVFASGKVINYSITFIEGWTIREVIAELARHPKLKRNLTERTAEAVSKAIGTEHVNPEGLLFPDTYVYVKGDSDLDILQRAYRKMQRVLEEEWAQRSDKSFVETPYQGLILASIVEKETGVGGERGRIAGVFTSRLNKGMRLQTDPTVIYGLGEQYRGNITRAHLKQPTPYNTYVIKGLPPTPIALPGRAAVHAAFNPEITGDLYFVAKGDGSHQFSRTLTDHNKAVRQYQLNRRKDYRSTQP